MMVSKTRKKWYVKVMSFTPEAKIVSERIREKETLMVVKKLVEERLVSRVTLLGEKNIKGREVVWDRSLILLMVSGTEGVTRYTTLPRVVTSMKRRVVG